MYISNLCILVIPTANQERKRTKSLVISVMVVRIMYEQSCLVFLPNLLFSFVQNIVLTLVYRLKRELDVLTKLKQSGVWEACIF